MSGVESLITQVQPPDASQSGFRIPVSPATGVKGLDTQQYQTYKSSQVSVTNVELQEPIRNNSTSGRPKSSAHHQDVPEPAKDKPSVLGKIFRGSISLCCFKAMPGSQPNSEGYAASDNADQIDVPNDNRQPVFVVQSTSPMMMSYQQPTSEEMRIKRIQSEGYYGDPVNGPFLGPIADVDVGKKTLVLDLDETLVHSSFKPVAISAFEIRVDIEGQIHTIYVCKRPGVDMFLNWVAQFYEVVIFTASLAKYADPLMDRLDPRRLCAWRLFRESCTIWNGSYVKDLSKLGRDLKDVIIIDNSPNSFSFQPDNAIPIKSWFDDMSDRELHDLMPILEALSTVEDITKTMRTTLGFKDSNDLISSNNGWKTNLE